MGLGALTEYRGRACQTVAHQRRWSRDRAVDHCDFSGTISSGAGDKLGTPTNHAKREQLNNYELLV
jgi:hypothetical protein